MPSLPPAAADTAWWAIPAADALASLGASRAGLSSAEAHTRLDRVGPNRLQGVARAPAWKILVAQLQTVVVALLVAATGIALFMGDHLDAVAIGAVLVINTALGFATELRAKRAMESLLRLDAPQATVLRDGGERRIDARALVPGDVIVVEGGETVPADARLLDATELRTNEASLTGESLPVAKHAATVVRADTPLPDRVNMLYKGSAVAAGRAHAVVTATGMQTELGRIGTLMQAVVEEDTPLERRLDALGRRLVVITLAIAAAVIALGVLRGVPIGDVVETGIALAVAAVPEGLPAVATVALAIGLRRMARRRALVRRLPAVETLGSVTVVCTDKTGTLTAGVMTATSCWTGETDVSVSGAAYAPLGTFAIDGRELHANEMPALDALLRGAALASRASISGGAEGWRVVGDPTDVALVVLARKAGDDPDALALDAPEVAELPFSSDRMLSAIFRHESAAHGAPIVAYVKGAPRRVIARCDRWTSRDGAQPLDDATRAMLLEQNHRLASRGLRVIALASGVVRDAGEESLRGLTFLGLVGMHDPPADGVRETIRTFRDAGIRTVMLTGDQRRTAAAIGEVLGVLGPGDGTLDGRDLQHLGDDELAALAARTAVFARISPEDKLRIVAGLQRSGEIVAMLGDGVNDAPALRKADVGVAMGARGTDVAKEAAGVVLQDDRFETIAAAVEEGRVVFDNIRKFIFYLFSCNLAEIVVLFAAVAVGLPLPLLPVQLLWLNLVTDTAPALALAFEPAEPGVMRRSPRDPDAAILSASFLRGIAFYGALIAAASLAAFVWSETTGGSVTRARTVVFMTLALAQLLHLGTARSADHVLAPMRALANPPALGALAIVLAAQLAAVYWAPLARVLGVEPLTLDEWAVIIPLSLAPAIIGQAMRFVRRDARRRAAAASP
jgi:P-type Ca2+ transporter type 2C